MSDKYCINCKEKIVVDENQFLVGSTKIHIEPEYGSEFDMRFFQGYLCDNCLYQLKTKQLVDEPYED